MTNRVPHDIREKILADYLAGDPTATIAARYAVSTTTIHRIASRAGVARNLVEAALIRHHGADGIENSREALTGGR